MVAQDADKAEELTQNFFAKLCERPALFDGACPEKGKFRDYLMQSLRNVARDDYRRNHKEAAETHPDQISSGGWEVVELSILPAAGAAFHEAWVKQTLALALAQVRTLCRKRRLEVHLNLFEGRYLGDPDTTTSWEELGRRYGMDGKTARERAEIVMGHYRVHLRRMLRNEITIESSAKVTEAAIDDEIQALLSPLRS